MPFRKRSRGSVCVLISIAIPISVAATIGHATCLATSDRIVRGQFVRCENASFHHEASGANLAVQRELDRALATTDAALHDRVRESYRLPPPGLVVVVSVHWQVSIDPWNSARPGTVEFHGEPREVYENVRYLWQGPPDVCENTEAWAAVDLRVTYPCCDTLLGDEGCRITMNHAQPAPDLLRSALTQLLPGD